MSTYKKLKAIYRIKKFEYQDKKPFNKKMKEWLKWHKPFIRGNYCPYCSSHNFKNNGKGFYRCKTCGERFIILRATDNDYFHKDYLKLLIKNGYNISSFELTNLGTFKLKDWEFQFKRGYLISKTKTNKKLLELFDSSNTKIETFKVNNNEVIVKTRKIYLQFIDFINSDPIFEVMEDFNKIKGDEN